MSKNVRLSILGSILGILLTVIVCMVLVGKMNSYTDQLAAQQTSIDTLTTQITLASAAQAANSNQAVHSATGMDMERKIRDDGIAEKFMSRVLTFTGYAEYQDMRKSVMADYGLTTQDQFVKSFLQSGQSAYGENADSLSSQYSDMTSMCYRVDEDTGMYYYFTKVNCIASGAYGGNGTVTSVFMYTVDADGNLANLQAYTL